MTGLSITVRRCAGKLWVSKKLLAAQICKKDASYAKTQGHAELSWRLADWLIISPNDLFPPLPEKISSETAFGQAQGCSRKIKEKLWVTGSVVGVRGIN